MNMVSKIWRKKKKKTEDSRRAEREPFALSLSLLVATKFGC